MPTALVSTASLRPIHFSTLTFFVFSGVANGWRATDGGQWWLRDSPANTSIYPLSGVLDLSPSGDYTANCFLGLFAVPWTPTPSNLTFNDNSCAYYTGSSYLCSTNDNLCLPGSYNSTGYEPCSLCQGGSYSSVKGSTSCASCAAGTYSSSIGKLISFDDITNDLDC